MLKINQNVYTVCARWNNSDEQRKYEFYISEKQVKTVHINENGKLVYIAGNYYELPFRQAKKNVYKSLSKPFKWVYLTKEEAEKEKSRREKLVEEKANKA